MGRPIVHSSVGFISVIFISTLTFVVSTFEELQVKENEDPSHPLVMKILDIIDIVAFAIFTIEYLTRLLCCPRFLKFFIKPMNLLDFAALLPFYASLVLEELTDYEIIGKAGKMIRLMKVLRMLRVYKLFRHFAGLHALLYTVQEAYKELGLIFYLIGKSQYCLSTTSFLVI